MGVKNPRKFQFEKKIKELQTIKRTIPKIIGNTALNHFLKGFDDEAFSDTSERSDPWKKRKTLTKRDKVAGRRNILVQSGALRRSIVVRRATWNRIIVGSYGIIYARRHNRGLKGMPKRQFIGESQILNNRIRSILLKAIDKAMK